MEHHQLQPESLFPVIAAQIREALSTMHLAALRAVPAQARELDPELDRRAAAMDQSYYRLLRLVNLLSAASVPPDAPLSLENRDMVGLLRDVCDRAVGLAELLGLELRFSCGLYRRVCAVEPRSIEQLLFHLLSNAFKFTPAGGTVTVELWAQKRQVCFSVTDTGSGISPERMDTLFDRYLHPDQRDPAPHGMGLGLALCRRSTVSLPERQLEGSVSDVAPFDYAGGFNPTLMALADALPVEAFRIRGL